MAQRLVMQHLDRITLVRKGKATAKHPNLREGVVEVVKAGEDDWYGRFAEFIANCPDGDIPEDWVEAFALSQEIDVEKAKKNNYASSRGPFAGPHNSFPIQTQEDVHDAARLIGHAQNPAAVKARIMRIARSKGFSLPKSWSTGTSVKKSELLDAFKTWLMGPDAPGEEEFPEGVQKAANPPHDHSHVHASMRGYEYSHGHPHGHRDGITPNSPDHDAHETAHAHQHVSKAGSDVKPEDLDALLADVQGLEKDLTAKKVELTALIEKAAKLETELGEVTKARDEAVKKAEDADKEKAEAVEKAAKLEEQVKEQSRQPLINAPTPVQKSQPQITSNMSFDDAFQALMQHN